MDLKKLPPSMLVLLGLGCPGVQACLSPPVDTAEASSSGVESSTVGPCLSPPADSGSGTGSGTGEVGPCLTPPDDSFGTSTSTGGSGTGGSGTGAGSSDTGTSSGSGSGSDGATIGPCLAPPAVEPDDTPESLASARGAATPASSRRAAIERVLARDVLPADVAAKLLGTSDRDP